MNSVTSNAVFNATKKITSGSVNLDTTYVTSGSIHWIKIGKIVFINIINLSLTSWNDGDKIIGIGLPPAEVRMRFIIPPLNSAGAAQLFEVQTNGRLLSNGGISQMGCFYGSAFYLASE